MLRSIEDMKNVDVRTVAKEELVDMRQKSIPDMESISDMIDYILKEQINWYVHRRGNIAVENEYTEGKTINDVFGIMVASTLTV